MLKPFQVNLIQPDNGSTISKIQSRVMYAGIALLASTVGAIMMSVSVYAASATWSPEQIVATIPQATNIRTAVNATGTSVVIWDQFIPGSADAAHLYGRW